MGTEGAPQNSARRGPHGQSQAMTMVGLSSLIIHTLPCSIFNAAFAK